jgi:hypothetical protein
VHRDFEVLIPTKPTNFLVNVTLTVTVISPGTLNA